jgi:rubredoxin
MRVDPLRGIADARGALADVISLPAGAVHDAPIAHATTGAFVALLRGSLQGPEGRCRAPAVAFVAPDAGSIRLTSGPDGAALLVLRFASADGVAIADADAPLWRCTQCGSIYDERSGDASAGVPPGTPWHALPDDWRCPDCDAPRAAFRPLAAVPN